MKLYRMMTMVAVAMLAMTAFAQQTTMSLNDEERKQTITVTSRRMERHPAAIAGTGQNRQSRD